MADEYEIKIARSENKKDVYDVLVKSFYLDMPLLTACNVTTPPPIDKWPALQTLEDGLTLIAVSPGGEIEGVCINVAPNEGLTLPGPVVLGQFWQHVLDDSNGLITHLETTTMELRILTVAENSRGKGIAKRLVKESVNLAKAHGYKSIFAMSTGAYVESAFKRDGWKCVYTLLYGDYANLNKEFKLPSPPHDKFTVYEKKLTD